MRDNGEVEKMSYKKMYDIVSSMEKEFSRVGFEKGNKEQSTIEEFNSHNTKRSKANRSFTYS